jgi:hypothetical protein
VAPAVRRAAELKAGDTQSASSGAACNNRFPALYLAGFGGDMGIRR